MNTSTSVYWDEILPGDMIIWLNPIMSHSITNVSLCVAVTKNTMYHMIMYDYSITYTPGVVYMVYRFSHWPHLQNTILIRPNEHERI